VQQDALSGRYPLGGGTPWSRSSGTRGA